MMSDNSDFSEQPSESENEAIPTSPTLTSTTNASERRIKGRTSWVWQHMPGPSNTEYLVARQSYWRCAYCDTQYRASGGTSIIASHLTEKHKIKDVVQEAKEKGVQ